MCKNWPYYPYGVLGAAGGLIGDIVIICGGHDGPDGGSIVDECYSLTSEKATFVTHMSVGRRYAAGIVINDNTLWVTGGSGPGTDRLASTEYVSVTGTMLGPDLPMALRNHAMVAINSTFSMVIGGNNGIILASTFFYDHNECEWIIGPSLMQARNWHAVGIVTDEVTGEHFVAVTGGRYYSDDWWFYLDSTEILQDGEWVQGKRNDILSCGFFYKGFTWYDSITQEFKQPKALVYIFND
jgi:hypothetical protein